MKTDVTTKTTTPDFVIRFYLTDGSVETFIVTDEPEARKIWQKVDPSRLFSQPRVVLAGEHSKSVFVSAQLLRIDFIQDTFKCWQFPEGYADVVELSEEEFNRYAHLEEPDLMVKRNQPTPVGDLLVSFLKLRLVGGAPLFLMVEFTVKLASESQSFMQFLLSKGGFHMRLREGGTGVVNLAHLAGYTVYPGVAQAPADAWISEPVTVNG